MTKTVTIAQRIQSRLINPNDLRNLRNFSKKQNMMYRSIPLKDGTSAKILANKDELDCLIMRNGQVLSAKGKKSETFDIYITISKIYEHIMKRNLAVKDFNVYEEGELASFVYVDKYTNEIKKAFE